MCELHKLAQAMCSIDLAESNWTQELPRLPIPDLWLTANRYMGSVRAVLGAGEELPADALLGCGLDAEQLELRRRQLRRTDQLLSHFILSEGPQLQRDLKEYANKCQNWATEFWLQDMYLSNPLPLPVNSNPFFMFPRQQFGTSEEMLMFATRIIQFSVDFKFRIDQQTLRQDIGSGHAKGKPLCMETYKNFFHSYRMPHEPMDRLLPQSRRSNHIVVASCNQFFILRLGQDPLDNPYRRDAGCLLNESSIFDQLLRIYRVSRENLRRELASAAADQISKAPGKTPKVGLFTTENRQVWAKVHKKLNHCGQSATDMSHNINTPGGSCSPTTNAESLRLIEDCLFVMCLDSLVSPSAIRETGERKESNGLSRDVSRTEEEAANIILTGGGSHLFTANRWFDKFLQIIVGRDGICGINIEHSASEGITVLRFLEEFIGFIKQIPFKSQANCCSPVTNEDVGSCVKFDYQQSATNSITSPGYVEPRSPRMLLEESDKITPLVWNLDEELLAAIDEAEVKVNKLVDNFSLVIHKFAHFGRSFIKSQHLSPDAFVQLALQYTYYKLHGQLVSTYESASLRQFRLGRVDNIRANTCETFDWIQCMLRCRQSGQSSFSEAEESFAKAITKQVEILRYTITGGGPDNHLLALKELAKIRYGADDLPELFTDPSYGEYLNFRLSTSQLPNESGITVGYGAVVPDGYGCSYNPCENSIVFCIASFHDCPSTSSSKFSAKLEESLIEMQQLCLSRSLTNSLKN